MKDYQVAAIIAAILCTEEGTTEGSARERASDLLDHFKVIYPQPQVVEQR